MPRTTAAFPLAVASTILCLCAPAQTFRPVPAHADIADGHRELSLPFGIPGFRTQILVDATQVGANGATLNSISFRADRLFSSFGPTQVPNVTIQLSRTNVAVGSLATTFASNVTGPTTVVFQGAVSLPAHQTGFGGPLSWDIVIPFAQPYSFANGQGNLLIDIVADNAGGGFATFFLDAMQAGGSATRFGTNGYNSFWFLRELSVSTGGGLEPRLLAPGQTIDFVSKYAIDPPGLLTLGTAPQSAPIDLGPFGAPTNFVYIDPIVLAPHSWVPATSGWQSTFQLAVPNNPAFVGATIYGQAVSVEPKNALGLIFCHAVEVRIGDQFEVFPLQQLDATDPAAATGTLVDFGTGTQPEYGAVAIRFEGTFF